MTGFLSGIIYINVFAKQSYLSMGIFDTYFLEQYSVSGFNTSNYIFYISKIRIIPVITLAILAATNLKRIAGICWLLWTGFSCGLILTTAVLKMGIRGIILCILAMFPHFICYFMVYLILIMYMFSFPVTKWNHSKTIYMALFLLLGIITECLFNPVVMDLYIRLL